MGYALQQKRFEIVRPTQDHRTLALKKWLEKQVLNEKFLELELSQALQSKLDIRSIARQFSTTLSTYIDHSGIQVSTTDAKVVTVEGKTGQYTEVVDLILDEKRFGTVTLMAQQPINQWSAIFFRYLARYLVHPVRNAQLIESLRLQTMTDPLTQTFNRAALEHDLHHEMARSTREGTPFTVVMLDIDHFKRINDRYGHQVGDQVLIELSNHIRGEIRDSDSLYRYGGEEFTLILRNTELEDGVKKVEALLNQCKNQHYSEADPDLRVTLSAGITSWRDHDAHNAMIERADQALYHSKESGRDRATAK